MEFFTNEVVFWLFCMGVPVFMAYNGGATAATVDTIQKAEAWSPTALGLLGAMDKIGMTLSAGIWGYVLQRVPAKMLLSLGLFINAFAVAVFATTMNCYVMYAAKILIGLSEGLQWVWAPLWVVRWADEPTLPLWINLSGCVAAGVGNGLGILIAGFSTAHGFPYALPFQIEAALLFLLLLAMWLAPASTMAISSASKADAVKQDMVQSEKRLRALSEISNSNLSEGNAENAEGSRPPTPSARVHDSFMTIRVAADMPIDQQLGALWNNTLFCRSTIAFASSNYINAGLAFIWIRLFIQLWALDKQVSVVSFLVITGVGGAIGIALSSNIEEGNNANRILVFLQKAMAGSCVGAVMASAGLLLQLLEKHDWAFMILTLTWGGMILLCMGLAATTGLIQIVCNNSVEDENVRSLGVGLVQVANNFVGNSLGPLLPQMVMDVLATFFAADEAQALFSGALSILLAAFLVFACVTSAITKDEKQPGQEPKQGLPQVLEDSDQQPLLSIFCCETGKDAAY